MQNEEFRPNRITIGELSAMYKVSRPTIRRWIKKIPDLGERLGHWYNSVQTKKILDHLCSPFLVFAAFLFSSIDAVGKNYDTSPSTDTYNWDDDQAHSDQSLVNDPADISTESHNPIMSVVNLFFLAFTITGVIKCLTYNPNRARVSSDEIIVRITRILFQVTSAVMAVVLVGYYFAKVILFK